MAERKRPRRHYPPTRLPDDWTPDLIVDPYVREEYDHLASFRMARYVLWPFGKTVEPKPGAGAGSAIMNGIWFIIAGWWLALAHVATAIAQSLTIVGLANAWVSLKMIPVTCFPFGKRIVDSGGYF